MSGESGTPETDRIERDLAQTRSRLDATIDALQDKLSPGQMVDQAVGYLKDRRRRRVRPQPDAQRDRAPAAGGAHRRRRGLADGGERPRQRRRRRRGGLPGGRDTSAAAGARKGDRRAATGSGPPTGRRRPAAGTDARGLYARGGGDTRRLTRDPRERDDLAAHGSYASAALEDLATKAHAAGSGVGRDAGEDDEAYEGRVHAARGAVLGLKRSLDETLAAFRERVDAAVGRPRTPTRGPGRAWLLLGRRR
jgi:hypothetical protein